MTTSGARISACTAMILLSAAACEKPAIGDCTSRTEDWNPGNFDRFVFEDTVAGLKGYRNGAGKVVIPPTYVAAYEFGPGGVAAAIDGRTPFVFIKPNGDVVAQAFGVDNGPDYFQEGFARVVANGRIGFMNERGNITIQPRFDSASSFCHGKADVLVDGEKFVVDTAGNRRK